MQEFLLFADVAPAVSYSTKMLDPEYDQSRISTKKILPPHRGMKTWSSPKSGVLKGVYPIDGVLRVEYTTFCSAWEEPREQYKNEWYDRHQKSPQHPANHDTKEFFAKEMGLWLSADEGNSATAMATVMWWQQQWGWG